MSTPLASTIAAVEAIWAAGWTGETAPVRWHANTVEATPSAASVSHWLHNSVEFVDEQTVAFGGGRRARERELRGSVVIRAFAKKGLGETELLRLLDKAVGVFRGAASAPLSFIGDSALEQPGASADGIWWCRSAIAVFVYRFQG